MSSWLEDQDPNALLNVFCKREHDAWRVMLGPGWCPPYLREYFDKDGEAFAAVLDFDDLNIYMQKRRAPYEKRPSKLGDMELTARSFSATQLALWLASELLLALRENPPNAARARGKRA